MAKLTKHQRESKIFKDIDKKINSWYSYYRENISNFKKDQEFLFLKQWTSAEESQFANLNKPMMTFNKSYDYFKKVVSEQRNNTPNLEVRAKNDKARQEDIDLRADIVRQIAYSSKSKIVYQTGFEKAFAGGFGAWRVTTDYTNSKSFDQQIFIRAIQNPERAFFDPNAKECTKHDGDFCGYYNEMSLSEFEKAYPDIKNPQSYVMMHGDTVFDWGDKNSIVVAEIYIKEWYSFTLYMLDDGRTVTAKEYKKIKQEIESITEMEVVPLDAPSALIVPEIVGQRKSSDYKIRRYKVIKGKILEESVWPSKELPFVFCAGDLHTIDGKEHSISFTRYIKDAQRFYNYLASELAQAVITNRREQFIATPANISGSQEMIDMWKNPSVQHGALLANPDPVTGQMPQRLPPPELSQTTIGLMNQIDQDLQSILGYYEASRGSESQEISGIAIRTRQRAANQAVGVFFDNLDRSIEQTGRIILALLPNVYDTDRVVKGLNERGEQRDIRINVDIGANKKLNSLEGDSYDVCIKAGPSFAVQREQALQMLLELTRANPQVFSLTADLIAENIDIENMPQLVERLENLVPPEILAKEKGLPPPQQQPNPQMMMQQQEYEMKMKELQLKAMQLQADQQKAQSERQVEAAKVMYDLEKLQQERELAGMRTSAEVQKADMEREADIYGAMSKIIGSHSQAMKHQHELVQGML